MQLVTTPVQEQKKLYFLLLTLCLNILAAQSCSLTSLDTLSPSHQASCHSLEVIYVDHVCGKDKRIFLVMGAGSHEMFSVQLSICRHTATATANTLTTQYMVRFSHLTVQLPEMRLFHTLNEQENVVSKMFL